MPFYVGDWLKCPEVRALQPDYRGLWFDMLCYMWESTERGYMVNPNGNAYTNNDIIRMVGLDNQNSGIWLTCLIESGVCSIRKKDGAIYSRKMVRDEEIRKIRKEAGKRGGNPILVNQTLNQKVKLIPESESEYESESKDEDLSAIKDLNIKEKDLKTYSDFTKAESVNWMNHILNCGYYKTVKIDEGKFQDDIDKLQRLDNLSPEDIILIREFLQEDFNNNGFSWTQQIGGPGKLRKRSNTGRKFYEQVLLSIAQTTEKNLTPSQRLYRDTMKGFNDEENRL